jgi:hypothetical protein
MKKLGDPNIVDYIGDLQQAATDAANYVGRKNWNYEIRNCIWAGQSDDGRKWAANCGKQPFPWEGATDSRYRLADIYVNENVRYAKTAFFGAKAQALPVESSDATNSKVSEQVLQWMLFQHCADDLRREVELAYNFRETYGLAVMFVGWRTETRTSMETFSMEALYQSAQQSEDAATLISAISDPEQDEATVEVLKQLMPEIANKKAVRELRENGETEFETPYIFDSRPEWTALEPWEDIVFPASTWSIQRAPWVCRRELLNENELRERVTTMGYDEDFVEKAVKLKGVTRLGWMSWWRRQRDNLLWQNQDRDLIEIWHRYGKQSVDGVTRVTETVFHFSIPDEWATNGLLDYEHGLYPFVEMATERTSRCLIDARGVPEIVSSDQQLLKTYQDFKGDRASLAIIPPVRVPANRGKMELVFGPAKQVPERRPGEIGFMEIPSLDSGTVEFQQSIRANCDEYFGRMTDTMNPQRSMLWMQNFVQGVLMDATLCIKQTFQLMQQYMTDVEIVRVTGGEQMTIKASREDIQGQFDIMLHFDPRDLDMEYIASKMAAIEKVEASDIAGVLDRAGITKWKMWAIDPQLAEQYVRDPGPAAAAIAEDEQNNLAKMYSLVAPAPLDGPEGAQIRLQIVRGKLMSSPDWQEKYRGNEEFRKVVDDRLKNLTFQLQQLKNAQTGRTGVATDFDPSQQLGGQQAA